MNGRVFCQVPRSSAEDIDPAALDAAHRAGARLGQNLRRRTRGGNLLLKIADRIEQNLEALAVAETLGQRQSGA